MDVTTPMDPPKSTRVVHPFSTNPRVTPGAAITGAASPIAPSAQYHYGANPNNNNQTDNPLSEHGMDPFVSFQVPPMINYPSPMYLVTLRMRRTKLGL